MAVHHRNLKLFSVVTFALVLFILSHGTIGTQQTSVQCGRSKFLSSRIVGGTETIANEFPWMVHFLVRRGTDGQLFNCGGTLISNIHVLTATHCVAETTRIDDIFNITLGAHDVSATSGDRQVVGWKRIVIPADDEHWMQQDIAIITLSEPVNFTGTI